MKRTVIAAVAVLSTCISQAATTNKSIIVTATRLESGIRDIPGNPTVITAEELRDSGVTSVPEALEKRAGLHVRNFSDNPSRASVDMRGFGENSHGRVLVLVNGRRINRPDQAPVNWSQVPLANIERIEVVRGAHTTLYGDYAVGGVINIITRRGSPEPQTEIGVMLGSYGFNDEYISTSGEWAGLFYNLSAGHQGSDGYRDRSAYENWFATLGLEADFTDYFGGWLDYSFTDAEYEMPGGLSPAELEQDRTQAGDPDNDAAETFNTVGLGIGLYPNENNDIIVDGGYSRKEVDSNFASWFSFNTWDINTYTLNPKYTYRASPFEMDNELTLGVDLSADDLAIELYGDRNHTAKNGSSDVDKNTVGFYAYDTLRIFEPLLLSGGARVEQARYAIEEYDGSGALLQDTSVTHDVSAFNLGVVYQPVEQAKLFARFDKLYRMPFLDEQILYSGFGSGFNEDLQPETGYSYEIGGAYTPTTNLNLSCTLFHMDMEDEIAYAVTNFATFEGSNFNMDETRHQGIELAADWQVLACLGLFANYTFQNVEFTAGPNDGNRVPLVPRNLLSAGLDYEVIRNLHFLADVTFTGEQYAGSAVDNSEGTELDAYTLVDLALRYTFAFKKVEMDLIAGVDNVFGEEYSPVAYGGFGSIYAYYPAPERTYKAGLTVRF